MGALCLVMAVGCVAPEPPQQGGLPFTLGGESYPFGDLVEIESVVSDSGVYEVGATLTVRGRYRLVSRPGARLYLGVTTLGEDVEKLPKPRIGPCSHRLAGWDWPF